MHSLFRACGALSAFFVSLSVSVPLAAQATPDAVQSTLPDSVQTDGETPWIYRGSDVPQDKDWLFGEMNNGLRYAVRKSGVPPRQVSIRIRLDVGSLHERDDEQGFAHLLEHLSFRESPYIEQGQAIPTWQRLGATFGSDTNALTSPTQTVYKLDLPSITPAKLDEAFKMVAGMIREPVLSQENLDAEIPIVLAEKRERGGAGERVSTATQQTLFAGQRLANRMPIGIEPTLRGAKAGAMQAFHKRWYRPENTVISIAGDVDAAVFAQLIEKYFGDWQGQGAPEPAPNFGDPIAPAGSDPANPVGELKVVVEPDLPRTFTYAVMRPWRPVQDTIVYNEGLLLDAVAQAIINRRLEARARGGSSYLYAQVRQDDVSRSTDATFVGFAPLTGDWQTALSEVRAVIADALETAPTQEEIDREVASFDSIFENEYEQRSVISGSKLADQIVNAVDIRETVAAPETVLQVFRGMNARFTPDEVLKHSRKLFEGDVIRSVYVTPREGESDEAALGLALRAPAVADNSARLAENTISFDDLEPIGPKGKITAQGALGVPGVDAIERVDFANGVRAILWANDAEPGRVAVKVRFGAGYRSFDAADAPYIALGEMALLASGIGELDQEDLDRISAGRKMELNFSIEQGVFSFDAQTRSADLADQLYLFAAKLAKPGWDPQPVVRMKAAAELAYDSFATSPSGIVNRDLQYRASDNDPRFATPDRAMLAEVTPEGFRKVWEPILKQGPVEVLIFGEFDRDEGLEALRRTFGAIPDRPLISADIAAKVTNFPAASDQPQIATHRGDANQAAAVFAWPTGGGIAGVRESRQLDVLARIFSNRLLDAMRERAGASYAPQVFSDWPRDVAAGGRIMGLAQLQPRDVPAFFAAADRIALDLATNPVSSDELNRVIGPRQQQISRALTGNAYWLYHLQGSSFDPRRVGLLRSLLVDYGRTTPQSLQALAGRYLDTRASWRWAIIPEGQELESTNPSAQAEIIGR